MASSSSSFSLALILLSFTSSLLFINAQKAPAPAPPGPINITDILDKESQYTTFIRLLTSTQVGDQINNQLNSSDQGLTVLAPTDNAFSSLKAGTLNGLSTDEQVSLVLYHVLPKYYTLAMFQTASNPVRTQSTREDGTYGLNFTTSMNQVNVSSGITSTTLNNVLSKDFPLAMYEVDKVLLPLDLFGPKPPKASPAPSASTPAKAKKKSPAAEEPATAKSKDSDSDSGSGRMNAGLMVLIGSICFGLL